MLPPNRARLLSFSVFKETVYPLFESDTLLLECSV